MEIPNNFPPWPNVDATGVDSATTSAPISTSAMPTPAPPSTSAISSELPSTSAMPILAPPTTFAMPTPAPMSTSPRATIPAAGKSHKKPGHEAQRPGSKKSKKIATQFVEQDAAGDERAIAPAPPSASAMPTELPSTSAMTSGKSHKRPGSKKSKKASPMIMTRSPVVNILARSAALKRAPSAVRHASAKRAKSTHPLESPSQLTTRQNTPSLQDLSPAAGTTSSHGWMRRRRKLVSRIWEEVEPIYDGKILVEGRCIHCRQVFPATRDTGSSHIGRHLKLLKVFYTATNLLSGSNYPTSHLYFPQLWNIKKILKKGASSENETIVYMVEQMEIKFTIYWKESFKQICVPVIFDPRFKFDLLEYLLKDFGSETEADTWMHEVKKAMQKLFDEYSLEILIHHQQEDHVSPDEQELEEEEDPLVEFDHYISRKKVQSNNELDRYLNEELYPRKKDLDILQWWKFNSSKYPVLSRMARDILAIPASTVPSESAFSSGGRIVSDYRCSLSCSTVEALICLQDWLRAADIEGNKGASVEREEADLEPQLDLMKQASTSEQRIS